MCAALVWFIVSNQDLHILCVFQEPSKEIDFARPVIHAKMKGKTVDTFIVITDATENDATGKTKSRNALTQYKKVIT